MFRALIVVTLAAFAFVSRADVVISEFLASNVSTLADEDGGFSDWIEIHNSGTNMTSLQDWGLTDNVSKLFKWRFPATNIFPGDYLVVFASNKDRNVPGAPLHTNFRLDAGGGYLALTRPDGTIASEFKPQYPPQIADVSYGLSSEVPKVLLVSPGVPGKWLVPGDGSLLSGWTTNRFDDSAWTAATNGVGFETGTSELGASLVEDIMADNPVGYWRLNGPTYAVITNSGSLANAANGTWSGDAQLGQTGAIVGDPNTAMRSPGGPGPKGTVPYLAALNPATSFSVEFWMKPEIAYGSALAPLYSRCGDNGYIVYIQGDGSLQFLQWIGSSWQAATTGPDTLRGMTNKWVHIACVFNSIVGPYGTQYIYTNGVLAGSNTLPGTFRNNTCGNFLIAYPPLTQNYQGGLDEMAIYGGALSGARVLAHYQAGVNGAGTYAATVQADAPLAWWRFGEPGFPPAPGITFNSGSLGSVGNGTVSGEVTSSGSPMTPPNWSGLESANTCGTFNPGQITVPYHAALNPATFTVEFWARCTGGAGGYRGVISDNWTSSNFLRRTGWNCFANSGNFWEFNIADGADFTGLLGPPVVLGSWIHLVATYDGVRLVLYANGTATGTNFTAFQPNTNSASLLRIGAATTWDGGWASYFPGDIDEVSLFSRALTPDEIAQRFQVARNGKVAGTRNYAGLIKTDLQAAMLGKQSSAFLRLPFVITNVTGLGSLKLRLKYDDGFVAWLNGVPVASANAPDNPDWQSAATRRSDTIEALQFDEFDLSSWRSTLLPGTNVLALQGLNLYATNTDFLLVAELEATYPGAYSTNSGYLIKPTPGGLNGLGSAAPGPAISAPRHSPVIPASGDDILVTCRIAPTMAAVATATLNWRVMYGPVNKTAMFDDGTHGDGAPGDGLYGAIIPKANYAAGQMVRWMITAADTTNRLSRWPLFLDPTNSPEYLGTMIADPSVSSSLPVWYWFAPDPAAAHTRTGARVAVWFNGEFYDNVYVRERGQATQTGAQKFDFNPGGHCKINDEIGRVEEANINGNGSDSSYMRQPVAYEVYRVAGQPSSACFPLLMRVNGGADRVGLFVEQVDKRFLERRGIDPQGALYKMVNRITLTPMFSDAIDGVEKKTRLDEDRSDLQEACNALQLTNDLPARAAWMFDNFNLASMVNMMACRTLVSDSDDNRKNMYFYRDSRGTKEWASFPWDKDWTFGAVNANVHPFRSDYAHEAGGANHEQWSFHYEALFNDPRTRQMVLRRMRSLMDQQLQPPGTVNGYLESRVDHFFAPAAPHLGGVNVSGLKSAITTRRTQLYVNYAATNLMAGVNALIPESQPANLVIALGAIEYNPASGNQNEEFIQLVNNNTLAVDISGWKLGGAVQHTFAPGTVILPTNVMYCSPDVVAFRARSGSPKGGETLFVQGNYRGHLSAWGESLTLTDHTGRLVSSNSTPSAPSSVQRFLRVTEIMYNPAPAPNITTDNQQFEFIELKNISPSVSLNLANVRFSKGITFQFTNSPTIILAPLESVLLVRNASAFTSRYGSHLRIAGQYNGMLDNSGESLRLEDSNGEEVLEFSYDSSWYPITDGLGFSLVIADENASWNAWGLRSSWRASGALNGSPGLADPAPVVVVPIRVNEALAHTDPPLIDTIELFNPTMTNVNVGGWFLSDEFFVPRKYRIPNNTTIAPGGFLTFTTNQFGAGANGFALSSLGEQVWLFAADLATNLNGYYHGFSFGPSPNAVSFGRYVNSVTNEFFVLQSKNTLGTNNALPRVGPLVISEIMYHPPDFADGVDNDLDEFIEVQNIAGTNVSVFDPLAPTNVWRLGKAVDFFFPLDVTLPPGARLLVVGFDPGTNITMLESFRSRYAIPQDVPICGPWSGKLDNSGEPIELLCPDKPNVTATNVTVPYFVVETVDYRDGTHWPTNADGWGDSLQRRSPASFGNDPVNWFSSTPTPGKTNYPNQLPVVTLSAPPGGSLFQLPVDIVLMANASDPDGKVARVEFYSGSTRLNSTTNPPYVFVWSNAPAGTHLLTARAFDEAGGSAVSGSAAIVVLTAPPLVKIVSPVDAGVFVAGQNLHVVADASDPDGTIARVEFYANGTRFGESVSSPFTAIFTNSPSGLCILTATAIDNHGRAAVSAPVRLGLSSGAVTNITLVPANSIWRYFDLGSLPATNWFSSSYVDLSWSNGPAQLGYNNGNDVTVVGYGADASAKYPTTYFRRAFVVTNANRVTSLTTLLKRDDGAVVYLNGLEVLRGGMPTGNIGYGTWASETVAGNSKFLFTTNTIAPWLLKEGTNLLAVEIHQVNAASSDILFELQLDGIRNDPAPFILFGPTNTSATIGAAASFGVALLGSGPVAYQWKHDGTNIPGRTTNPCIIPNVSTNDAGKYSVLVSNLNGSVLSPSALLTVLPADSDEDGMPDDWELLYGLQVGVNDANLDPDSDGLMNWQESLAGTNPTNAASALRIDSIESLGKNGVALHFTAMSNRTYAVQFRAQANFGAWSNLIRVLAAPTNRTLHITNGAEIDPRRLFRLSIP